MIDEVVVEGLKAELVEQNFFFAGLVEQNFIDFFLRQNFIEWNRVDM